MLVFFDSHVTFLFVASEGVNVGVRVVFLPIKAFAVVGKDTPVTATVVTV